MTRLAPILVAGTAFLAASAAAQTVTVDFSSLTGTTDITFPATITLDGVTFTDVGASASVDSSGVFGVPNNGILEMTFSAPITQLSFSYSDISSTQTGPVNDALIAILSNGDLRGPIAGPLNQTLSFSYQGSPFDMASLLFALEADSFTVDTISDTLAPEPTSLLMFASGVLGLAVLRRKPA
jgi:hypothetical protein